MAKNLYSAANSGFQKADFFDLVSESPLFLFMQFKINSILLKSIFRYDGIEFIGAFRKLKNVSCGVITTIVSQVTLPVQKDFLEQ